MTKFYLYTYLFLFVFASNVFANGGPVEWTGTTPLGGVGLKQNQSISLKKETLKIKMLADLNSYEVQAEYTLNNPAKEEIIEFGIPISWFRDSEFYMSKSQVENLVEGPPDEMFQDDIRNISKNILISVNGGKNKCEPVLNRNFYKLNDSADIKLGSQTIKAWCVSKLHLNKGTNKIEMKYVSEMSYVDEAYSKSALTYFGPRRLNYIFYPASYWKGAVEKVKVEVELGAYQDLEKVNAPTGFKKSGSKLYWEQSNVDFRKVKELDIVFDKKILEARQLATWNSSKYNYYPINKISKVHASSYLKSNGSTSYKPENIIDGKPETAWCEGRADNGIGEYIEIQSSDSSFSSGMKEYCGIEGLMITAGYMKSQHVYELNNKVSTIKVSDCKDNNPRYYNLDVSDNFNFAPNLIKDINEDFFKSASCLRFEIFNVKKGKVSDTCISEISLVINCG